jgi:ribonuclease-3
MSNFVKKLLGHQEPLEGYLFDDELPEDRLRELKRFCKEHDIHLADLSLIDQALTHTSFAHESEQDTEDYERLEFLGDSVIGLVVVEYLYNTFPDMNEGDMTKIKSDVVSQATLSEIATELGLNRLMHLGKGEVLSRGRRKPSILSDTFEALVGALYLSSTIDETKEFVTRQLEGRVQKIVARGNLENYKSLLQRVVLERFGENPTYRVLTRRGPQHSAEFVVGVEIKGKIYGKARGRSKKDAEMRAAHKTLQMLRSKKRQRAPHGKETKAN